jgi:hypothetical protein
MQIGGDKKGQATQGTSPLCRGLTKALSALIIRSNLDLFKRHVFGKNERNYGFKLFTQMLLNHDIVNKKIISLKFENEKHMLSEEDYRKLKSIFEEILNQISLIGMNPNELSETMKMMLTVVDELNKSCHDSLLYPMVFYH